MIGILGGYGESGLVVSAVLNKWGVHSLRIGGRNIDEGKLKLEKNLQSFQCIQVDINNSDSVEQFIKGCDLVINCVGPSYETSALVARKALEVGCHYVDVGFNKELESMKDYDRGLSVIYAAGSIPGLSGILPKYLSKDFHKVESLTCYTGILDKFTSSAAEDYLAGILKNNNSMAWWKEGSLSSEPLKRKSEVELPYFSQRVNLYPYFDNETQYLANELSLENGKWYMALEGHHMQNILEEVCFQFLSHRKEAVERLCKATALDVTGKSPYINFLIEVNGVSNKSKETKTLILQGSKPSTLTGSIAAIVARAILEGKLESGIKSLAEVSNLERIMELLIETEAINIFTIENCSIEKLLQVVEGEI